MFQNFCVWRERLIYNFSILLQQWVQIGSSTNTAEANTGLSLILPSQHKTKKSPIKQNKPQLSFVGCQQHTMDVFLRNSCGVSQSFQDKASRRWSPMVNLAGSALLSTSVSAARSTKSCPGCSQGIGCLIPANKTPVLLSRWQSPEEPQTLKKIKSIIYLIKKKKMQKSQISICYGKYLMTSQIYTN